MTNIPPRPQDLEGTYFGIPVCHIGEDGDMLALGHHGQRRTFAAFNRHARTSCHLVNIADDHGASADDWLPQVHEEWVTFRLPDPERGEDPDFEWYCDQVAADAPGSVPITTLRID